MKAEQIKIGTRVKIVDVTDYEALFGSGTDVEGVISEFQDSVDGDCIGVRVDDIAYTTLFFWKDELEKA